MFPSDSLLGRLYRENQRNSATVLAVRKVQSLYMTAMPEKKKGTALAAGITVTLGKELEPIRSIYRYYVGLRILGNGYAITGQHKVNSRIWPSAPSTPTWTMQMFVCAEPTRLASQAMLS